MHILVNQLLFIHFFPMHLPINQLLFIHFFSNAYIR